MINVSAPGGHLFEVFGDNMHRYLQPYIQTFAVLARVHLSGQFYSQLIVLLKAFHYTLNTYTIT